MDAAAARSSHPLAGHVAAGAVGGVLGAVATVAAAVVGRGRTGGMSLAPHLLLGASASAGAALVANAATGGSLGDRIADATWGNRHKLAFALRNVHRPHVLLAARDAHAESRAMEARVFGPGPHGDNGIDAVRHAYASGLLAARLVHDHRMSAEAAIAIVDAAGRAHELDTDREDRHALSSRMDLHNNAVGASVGVELAQAGTTDPGALFDGVVAALGDGRLVVIERGELRPSTASDLPPN